MVGASPWGQGDDLEQFVKPAWALTLSYPPGWTLDDADGHFKISVSSEEDYAEFIMAADAAFGDAGADLTAVFEDVATYSDGLLDLAEGWRRRSESRSIAGQEAEAADPRRPITSGAAM